LSFDPKSIGSGRYSQWQESGRVDRVVDLLEPEKAQFCPSVLNVFHHRFKVVTVSETRPIGTERVWLIGLIEGAPVADL